MIEPEILSLRVFYCQFRPVVRFDNRSSDHRSDFRLFCRMPAPSVNDAVRGPDRDADNRGLFGIRDLLYPRSSLIRGMELRF
jgi:hypothetical protein